MSPVFLRAAIVLFCAGFAFFLALFLMRRMRKRIADECDIPEGAAATSVDTLPLHLYNTVIQQLKQQKYELLVQSQAEQQRARTSENFSHAVLSNLSCGVLVFGANGLVKTANPAAKAILGFASTTGMSADDIFRSAEVYGAKSIAGVFPDETQAQATGIAAEIHTVLREGIKRRQVEADYKTPAGEKRFLSMTISQVPTTDGNLLGVTCLINDLTELENIRRQQELQGEISAEMALQLRTSLTTISGYAQQLANNRDPEMAKEIATDIAHEAAQLDRTIGGFLTTKPKAGASSASSR